MRVDLYRNPVEMVTRPIVNSSLSSTALPWGADSLHDLQNRLDYVVRQCYNIIVTKLPLPIALWLCTHTTNRSIASLPYVIISMTTHPTIVRTFSGGILWACPSHLGQVVVHLGDGKIFWQPCHPRQSVPKHLLPMFCPAWVNVWILQFIICLKQFFTVALLMFCTW